MLRITIHRCDDDLVMKLEGRLTDVFVPEVERAWRETTSRYSGSVRVDLRGVYLVDEAGRELMTQMYHAGAAFLASGCVMPELVREVTQLALAGPSRRERN